jgi:hypothetical protein
MTTRGMTSVELHSRHLVAVDPGGVHVGVATFEFDDGAWECVDAEEMTPDGFSDWLANALLQGQVDILVFERFILEPGRAMSQVGSEMETSQLIGVIKWLWRHSKNSNRWPGGGDVVLVGQTNQIKAPTRGVLRKRGIKSRSKQLGVTGGHSADAELHGYYHIIKTLGQNIRSPS